MPLLYGEGENAFWRLQEEIIKVTNHQSIFAWQHENYGLQDRTNCFAKSARDFISAGKIIPTPTKLKTVKNRQLITLMDEPFSFFEGDKLSALMSNRVKIEHDIPANTLPYTMTNNGPPH